MPLRVCQLAGIIVLYKDNESISLVNNSLGLQFNMKQHEEHQCNNYALEQYSFV